MKLICPDCGAQYESGKFCLECGAKLQEVAPELVCPSCGYKAKSGKFCPECGTKMIEQIDSPIESAKKEATDRKFNERDSRFAKYYDKKGFPRTIPQEERDVAIEELTPFANQNIAEAKMLLGHILLAASDKDTILKGVNLLKEAETSGNKLAYYFNGAGYYYGFEPLIEQNHEEAEKRLTEAYQEYKDGGTAGFLAHLYAFSPQKCNYKKAFDYATLAAEDDEEAGYFVLGALYLDGWGVAKDIQQAIGNYKMSAAYGNETAMSQIGIIFMGNEGVEENPDQSFYWFNEAAKKGSDVGMFNLGCCYKNGYGTEVDIEMAAEWFKKAAEQGYVYAMVELGEYYKDTLLDFRKAKMWYLKAAELGNDEAQNRLAVLYFDIENDYKEAVKWYKKAMEQDNPWAYRNYAFCLWNGNGVKENKKKAMEMMQKAVSLGHPDAENELNEMQQEFANSKKEEEIKKRAEVIEADRRRREEEKAQRDAEREAERQRREAEREAVRQRKAAERKEKGAIIENVKFSTDGRKTLFLEFECEYYREFEFDGEIEVFVYANNKIIPQHLGGNGFGEQLSKNREKFRYQIQDYKLNLKTNKINNVTFLLEARQLDERWDGTQDIKIFPLIASCKTCLKLYHEYHFLGKNILEIRNK